eukprot:TRINITY_DN11677_c0_g1_i4.p1 TRINITY_DN11677_c0_g1~~TRINITY_DN11677_c0_g1_i4.p1  ORF type:complete len:2111 (+),score=761.37 TRINITY_DN11677_c0_g1_i4:802-6333(+)
MAEAAKKAAEPEAPAIDPRSVTPAMRKEKATETVVKVEQEANATLIVARTFSKKDGIHSAKDRLAAIKEELQDRLHRLNEIAGALGIDVSECKKHGVTAMKEVQALSSLVPRIQTLQLSVTTELNKIVGLVSLAASGGDVEVDLEKVKDQEDKDARDFEITLPNAKDVVTQVDTVIEAVTQMANPLMDNPPKGPDRERLLTEVETAAGEAQNRLTEARNELNAKITSARKYQPTTRKVALLELSNLQGKLAEAQKTLNTYKNFKKEFALRVTARQALVEIHEKVSTVEVEVGKVTASMDSVMEGQQMADEEIAEIEKVAGPAQQMIKQAMTLINGKVKTASGAMKDELEHLKHTATMLTKKLEEIAQKVRMQRDGLLMKSSLDACNEKAQKAEENWKKCAESENPLQDAEATKQMPKEELDKVLKVCEDAGNDCVQSVNQAKVLLRRKMDESKRYTKILQAQAQEQIIALQARVETVEASVAEFRKGIIERKFADILGELMLHVAGAEEKVDAMENACMIFMSDDFESGGGEAGAEGGGEQNLPELIAKGRSLEKQASEACTTAKQMINVKQREAPKSGSDVGVTLAKLLGRVNVATETLGKQKQAIMRAEKVIKIRDVTSADGAKMDEVEKEVERFTTADFGAMTDEEVKAMDDAMVECLKTLKTLGTKIQPLLGSAPPVSKGLLQKLLERRKQALDSVESVRTMSKERRERVLCNSYIKEATAKVDALDEAVEKMNDAELPFLRGLEVLPMDETNQTISACEKAAATVMEAMSEARTYTASKNLESKSFNPDLAKELQASYADLAERINQAASKLGAFKKDTELRKKAAQLQDAGERVEKLESDVVKVLELAQPFVNESAQSAEEAELADALKEYLDFEKDLTSRISSTKTFLAERQRVCRDNAEQLDQVKSLQARLTEVQQNASKAKKATLDHEHRFLAKKIMEEAKERVASLDGDVTAATEACEKLLVKGGQEFLVATSLRSFAWAVSTSATDEDSSEEALFKTTFGGKTLVDEATFVKTLEELPEKLQREDVVFSAERRAAMFKQLAAEDSGMVTFAQFQTLYRHTGKIIKAITMTDGFNITESKTTSKVSIGEQLEMVGPPKRDEGGMLRAQFKIVSKDETGWITIQTGTAAPFVDVHTAFSKFCEETDRKITAHLSNCSKTGQYLSSKVKEVNTLRGQAAQHSGDRKKQDETGPLAEAKRELEQLRNQASKTTSQIESLKNKFSKEKTAYKQKEKEERDAHIIAKERKEAEQWTAEPGKIVEETLATAKELESKAKPLVEMSEEELKAMAKPSEKLDELEELRAVVDEKVAAAKTAVRAKQTIVVAIKPPTNPANHAKKDLQNMMNSMDAQMRTTRKAVETLKKRIVNLITDKVDEASAALRKVALKNKQTCEDLFKSIAGEGAEEIPSEKFCSQLSSLEGLELTAEHAKLLCRHVERSASGKTAISRRNFLSFVDLYYLVVKETAITDSFDVSACKIIRKANMDEVVEVIEGPVHDEKLGLQRIRGRSLVDGNEGWLSIVGNTGTAFLKKVDKPLYRIAKNVVLESDFASAPSGGKLRELHAEEIVELLEGPRREVLPDTMRARVKIAPEGVTGWITIKDKLSTVYAEQNPKLFTCTQSIALTDGSDVKTSKVLRKLNAMELVEAIGEVVVDDESSVERIECKCLKDGKTGWFTIRGNQGTVYGESKSSFYSTTQPVQLQRGFASENTEVLRELPAGQALTILEGPKGETTSPPTRAKVSALKDGTTGWVTMQDDTVKKFPGFYTVSAVIPMHDTCDATSAKVLRELAKGEHLELLEGPTLEEGKDSRIRCRSVVHGTVGWVTLKESSGKRMLTC